MSNTRNRMISSTLSGILHVRYGMKRQGIYCTQFTPTSDVLKGEAIQCIEIVVTCDDSNDCDILEFTID